MCSVHTSHARRLPHTHTHTHTNFIQSNFVWFVFLFSLQFYYNVYATCVNPYNVGATERVSDSAFSSLRLSSFSIVCGKYFYPFFSFILDTIVAIRSFRIRLFFSLNRSIVVVGFWRFYCHCVHIVYTSKLWTRTDVKFMLCVYTLSPYVRCLTAIFW